MTRPFVAGKRTAMIARASLAAVMIAILCSSDARAADAALGTQEFTSVDELANAVTAHFPKIQGELTSVQGDQVAVSLGTKNGLRPGIILTLWRDGAEILHPVTGAVIGRKEDEVGSIEVTAVSDASSEGKVHRKLKEPKAGDKARITPKKMRLAMVPLRTDRSDIITKLAERLKEGGRFELLDGETVGRALAENKQHDRAMLNSLVKAHRLDVAVTAEVLPSDAKYLVNLGIIQADDSVPAGTIVALLDLRTKRDALGEVRPFFAPTREEKGSIMDLGFDAQLFVAADLQGDGTIRYAFSDGARIRIYEEGPTGWREAWAETIPYDASEMQHISLDAADINGNGRPELFVTGMRKGTVVSSVIEFTDGIYHRTAEVPGFLRVVPASRGKSQLIGCGYHPVNFTACGARQVVWSHGTYTAGAEVALPKGAGLYGSVFMEAGEAAPLFVWLDEKDRLTVSSNNVPVWKSEEKYPSSRISVHRPLTGMEELFQAPVNESERERRIRVPGRVLTLDLDGDGRDELIVPKNGGESFLTGFREAELVSLNWTGVRLEQRRSIKDIPGAVIDFQIVRQGGAAHVIALVLVPGGPFRADRKQILAFAVQ